MLLAIRGDEQSLIEKFKAKYLPVNEYKTKNNVPQQVILILGLTSPQQESPLSYFKVVEDSLIPLTEEQFIHLRKESIKSNSCLYNTIRTVAENSPVRFLIA